MPATRPRSRDRRMRPITASSRAISPTPDWCCRCSATSGRRIMHLAAESHVDRSIDGPAAFVETNVVGTVRLLQAALEYWRTCPEAKNARASASTISPPTKCSATCRSTAGSSPKRRRTRRPRLIRRRRPRATISSAPGTRPTACRWCSRTARTITGRSLPRKADPADDPQRARGQAACPYMARARMSATGSMSRIMPARSNACSRGGGRRDLSDRRPGNERDQSERGGIDLRHPRCSACRCPEAPRTLISFVTDRPGHDRRYAIDRDQAREGAWLDPEEAFDPGSNGRSTGISKIWWWEPIRSSNYAGERLGAA
jgi:dTDP-glucose 4,6-dehydratase